MTDDKLVEAVARAIWEADGLNSVEWDDCPIWDIVIGQAIAAIAAVRQHTQDDGK